MKTRFAFCALLLGAFALATPVYAQEVTVDGNSHSNNGHGWGRGGKKKPTVDGETDWNGTTNSDFNTGSNWTAVTGSAPPVAGDVAWFTATPSNKSVNLSTSVSIAGLFFSGASASGYSLTNSAGAVFTLTATGTAIGTETGDSTAVAIGAQNTSGTNTISAPVTLASSSGTSTIFQASGGELIISGVISGDPILSKIGGGTLTLSGINTYNGGTTINAGTVKMSGSGTLGSTSGTLTMAGGTLDLNGTNQSVGALNGSSGTILNEAPSGGGGAKTLTVGTGDTSGSFSGTITDHDGLGSGFVKLVKTGTGTQTMTSTTSNYTGGTDINGGTLISNSSNGGALGRGPIAVNSGGTLAGAQTIDSAATITVNSGGTLMPGTTDTSGSFVTLNTGAVTLASGSTFAADINGGTGALGTGNGGAGSAYDIVNVTGALSLAGQLSLTLGATPLAIGDKFFLFTYTGSETGTFSNTTNSGLTYTQGPDAFLIDYSDIFNGTTAVSLTVTAIPEPSTWIVALLTCVTIGWFQRRRFVRPSTGL